MDPGLGLCYLNYLDSADLIYILNNMIFQSEEINLTHLARPNWRFRMTFLFNIRFHNIHS